jgi:hypothetical protein
VQVAALLVFVQVKNKRKRSLQVRPPGVEKTSRLYSTDPVTSGVKCGAAWWHEQQDEVVDGFLVEPQNQGRVGTTWKPSHEWKLAEATPSSRGFWWFTRKPLGSLVDPQSQDRRTEDGAAAAPDRSDRWV